MSKLFQVLIIIFFGSLLFGQLGGLMLAPGIVIYIHDIVLPFVLIVGVLQRSKKKYEKTRLGGALCAFLIISGISLGINAVGLTPFQLLVSAMHLVRFAMYISLYGLVMRGLVADTLWLWLLYASGQIFSFLGLMQYALYPTLRNLYYLGWDEHYYRLFSTFLDPNFAGIFLVLSIFLGFYLFIQAKKNIFIGLSILVLFISFLLTYSRSSFLGFGAGLMAAIITSRKITIGFIVLLIFILCILFLPTRDRLILSVFRSESVVARIGNWYQSIGLFSEKPILGHGFNTIRFIAIDRGWARDEPYVSRSAAGVDSSLLFVAITTGMVGLAVYLLILIRQCFIGVKLVGHTEYGLLGIAYVSSILGLVVHSFFVNSLFYPWIVIWLWILTGVVERRINSDS